MYEENAPIKYVQPQTLAAMSSSLAKRVHNQCRNYQFYITAQCCPPAIPYIILVYLQWMNCQGLVSSDLVCHYRLVLWRSTHLGLVGRSFYDFDPDATWNGQHGDKRCWPCCQRWRYCMAAWNKMRYTGVSATTQNAQKQAQQSPPKTTTFQHQTRLEYAVLICT